MLKEIVAGVIVAVASGVILSYMPEIKKWIGEWWQRRYKKPAAAPPTASRQTVTYPPRPRAVRNDWIDGSRRITESRWVNGWRDW